MTNLLKQVRHAVNVALEHSTSTSSGVEVHVTGTGAVRVDPADVLKYQSTKDQAAAVRKILSKTPVSK